MSVPLLIARSACAECHALVEAHALADDRGLADHHAGAVIDEEAPPIWAPGMNVDAGAECANSAITRDSSGTQSVELVGEPVMDDRVTPG